MGLHPARVARDAAQQLVLEIEREVDQFPMALHEIRALGAKMIRAGFLPDKIADEVRQRLERSGLTKEDLRSFCRAMSKLDEAGRKLRCLETHLFQTEADLETSDFIKRQNARRPPHELNAHPRRINKDAPSLAHRFTHLRSRWD